jgi:hypothetical protein
MMTRLVAVLLLLMTSGLTSACTATAEPPTPTATNGPITAGKFPDMSSYAAANPADFETQYETPGRPNAPMKSYNFVTPGGIQCSFDAVPSAGCTGNNFPGVAAMQCDPAMRAYEVNAISTGRGIWQTSDTSCDSTPTAKVLPPFHTLTVYGVTCGVDDAGMTACKDPQGRGFVLSPSWSGWIPKV